jgi:hypothetical protein
MMLEGINDIGNSSTGGNSNSGPLTSDDPSGAAPGRRPRASARDQRDRLHDPSYEGAAYFREEGEAIR